MRGIDIMIIAVVGPTGVGKTKMSIELAKKYNAEIINADSTQIYKEINIGTAKVTEEESEGIKHHLIDICSLNDTYTVYDYQIDARRVIEELKKEGKNIVIVGGSGLYLSALLYDYKFNKESNVYDFDSLSDEEMHITLKNLGVDIDKNNRQRLIRGYAKYVNNSEPITPEVGGTNLIYDAIIVGLTTERETLHKKINARGDQQIEQGLIQEVRYLFEKHPNSKELKTAICYKEFIPYLNDEIYLEDVLIKIKQHCRQYAKRQYTWLNHKMDVKWFDVNFDDFNFTINEVTKFIGEQIK